MTRRRTSTTKRRRLAQIRRRADAIQAKQGCSHDAAMILALKARLGLLTAWERRWVMTRQGTSLKYTALHGTALQEGAFPVTLKV